MSQETTENFIKAFSNLEPINPPKIFYRLYYDDEGKPLFYSMEDLPGNYIEIDKDTYLIGSGRIRVINGQIKHLKVGVPIQKLVPDQTGIPCATHDVTVVVDESAEHVKWNLKYYD